MVEVLVFLQLLFNDAVYIEPVHRPLLQVLRLSGLNDFIRSGSKLQNMLSFQKFGFSGWNTIAKAHVTEKCIRILHIMSQTCVVRTHYYHSYYEPQDLCGKRALP
jgi:hypothetical protein